MPDKMMRIAGRGDDGTAKALNTTNDGTLKTQLSGSNIEEIIIADEVVLTDTSSQTVSINTSDFSEINLYVRNRLGVDIEIRPSVRVGNVLSNVMFYDYEKENWSGSYDERIIVPHIRNYVTDVFQEPKFYWMKDLIVKELRFHFRAVETPDPPQEGDALSIVLVGKKI